MNETHIADGSPGPAGMNLLPPEGSVAAGASAVSWGSIVAGPWPRRR